MKHWFGKTIVIALGGSVVHPDEIDVQLLKKLNSFFRSFIRKKYKFVLVVGGGKLSRRFQDAARRVVRVADEDQDWLGIHATRLNAHLLRTIFRDKADPVIIDSRFKIKKLRYPLTIASGWRPGWSTDYVAMQIAADFGVKEAVIAGKPSHVYDKDFMRYKNAKRIDALTWKEYQRLIPAKWKPGFSSPIDPVAARVGASKKITAIVIQGKDLKNFRNLLNGKEFRGSVIR